MSNQRAAAPIAQPDRVFVLSGPSGVGKNTVAEQLCERRVAVRPVTATTRRPREGETDGVDYFFLTESEFARWRAEGKFVESVDYAGCRYGTPVFSINEALSRGLPALLVVDVEGALKIKEQWPGVTLIFLAPPSEAELRKRLQQRGQNSADEIEHRLRKSRQELAASEHYNYFVVNSDLLTTVKEVTEIITSQKESGRR